MCYFYKLLEFSMLQSKKSWNEHKNLKANYSNDTRLYKQDHLEFIVDFFILYRSQLNELLLTLITEIMRKNELSVFNIAYASADNIYYSIRMYKLYYMYTICSFQSTQYLFSLSVCVRNFKEMVITLDAKKTEYILIFMRYIESFCICL